jgi:hypothetical protein
VDKRVTRLIKPLTVTIQKRNYSFNQKKLLSFNDLEPKKRINLQEPSDFLFSEKEKKFCINFKRKKKALITLCRVYGFLLKTNKEFTYYFISHYFLIPWGKEINQQNSEKYFEFWKANIACYFVQYINSKYLEFILISVEIIFRKEYGKLKAEIMKNKQEYILN